MQKRNFILLTAILCTVCMMLIDGLWQPPYFLKSLLKIAVFGGSLLAYAGLYHETPVRFRTSGASLKRTVLLAVGIYALIVGGFFLTRQIIDYSHITGTLTSTIGVSKENFLYVSLYISLVNSLLEELFFRGYAYLTLRRYADPKFCCFLSAGLFAVYHGGMLYGWFHVGIYLLMLAGLFAAGLLFNALDNKPDAVLPSWLPHMFANFGINTAGFILFAAS